MLEALHDDKSEQIMTVFCAASWFPQNKKFFLDKAIGRIAFSARLSKSFDNPVENSIRPLALGRLCCTPHNLPYVGIKFMLAS